MIKIAFFDVDGTLVPFGQNKLSPRTEYALKKLQENGIKICEATGRTVAVMPRFENVDFDLYMTFNGSYCFTNDEVVFKNPLPVKDVLQIYDNITKMNRGMSLANDREVFRNDWGKNLGEFSKLQEDHIKFAPNFEDLCYKENYQIIMDCTADEYDTILKGTTGVRIVAWCDEAVDIIPMKSGKGMAVEKILEHYGFDKDEAIAFGDGDNDIEMFEAVGTGVAMANSAEKVKEAADDVCPSVEEDGIYWYCLKKGLIQ